MPAVKELQLKKRSPKKTIRSTAVRTGNSKTTHAGVVVPSLVLTNTVNATTARQGLFRLMDETAESHTPILVTGRRTNAVLMSEEDYRSIQESLYLISIPGLREDLLAGMKEPVSKMPTRRTLKW